MEVNYRIGNGGKTILKGYAYIAYGANFLIEIITDWIGVGLFVSPVFMFFAYVGLIILFKLYGVSVYNPKTLFRFILYWLASIIPVINLLFFNLNESGMPEPGIVGMVDLIIKISREEDDAEANKDQGKNQRYQRNTYRPRANDNRYYEEDEEVEETI